MFIDIDDIKINYIDEYDKEIVKKTDEAILFLHGWGSNLNCFIDSINLLKVKYRVLAIDLPGFGLSSEPSCSYCVDDYCNIIIKFLKKIEIKKVVLIGHSYGGRIIIKLNNKNDLPFNIEKNILIDSAGIKHKLSLKNRIKVRIYKLFKYIINIIPNKNLKNNILDRLKSHYGSDDYKNATEIMRQTLVKSISEDLTNEIKNIQTETLIIWGENDKDTPLSDAEFINKNIKNSGLVVIKNVGHFSFIEDRWTYLKVMKSYFNI